MKQKLEHDNNTPLAARMRPESLKEYIGQKHLVGRSKPIRKLIETDELVSMIFWGPPGCGKTTLARIIANETKSTFIQMSAVNSGKADIRKVVEQSKTKTKIQESIFKARNITANQLNRSPIKTNRNRTILFIDEIHRFNKVQQDFLLPYVEDGVITLIGATTENPSFEVISPLLSRCRVFILKQHISKDIKKIVMNAINDKVHGIGRMNVKIQKNALEFLANSSNGDPRTALNALELGLKLVGSSKRKIELDKKVIEQALQHKALLYDKNGEEHYNTQIFVQYLSQMLYLKHVKR
jgi:putative ATPase